MKLDSFQERVDNHEAYPEIHTCDWCGEQLDRGDYHAESTQKDLDARSFCSMGCYNEWRADGNIPPNSYV